MQGLGESFIIRVDDYPIEMNQPPGVPKVVGIKSITRSVSQTIKRTLSGNLFSPIRESDSNGQSEHHHPTNQEMYYSSSRYRSLVELARDDFRFAKYSDLLPIEHAFPTYADVARQWRRPKPEIDDVIEGICVSLLLPYMQRVVIYPKGLKCNKIRIEAQRSTAIILPNGHRKFKYFCGEYTLKGLDGRSIRRKDLSYAYNPDVGLLCVFVDTVQLRERSLFRKHPNLIPKFSLRSKSNGDLSTTSNVSQAVSGDAGSPGEAALRTKSASPQLEPTLAATSSAAHVSQARPI